MPANQMRRTAADPVLIRTGFKRLNHIGMISQPQIIIAAKIDDIPAVNFQINALRGFDDPPRSIQALLGNIVEIGC